MKVLDRYTLNSPEVLAFLQDNLEGTNLLSSSICKSVTFDDGVFYTFLPQGITDEQLYGFKWGGLGGNVREKIVDMLFEELQNHSNLICIFDDVDGRYHPLYKEKSFLETGVHFEEEIYYLINKKNSSKPILLDCLRTSNAFWHSLCMVSNVKYARRKDRSITESEIAAFAKGAQMIILGAYDGEGYVCWERINRATL